MTVTLPHLRSLTDAAANGAQALGILFDSREFHPEPGRRRDAAEAVCALIESYLALKPGETVELALTDAPSPGNKAAVISGGRGKAGELIAQVVALFTTTADSVPMLGFDRDMLAPFRSTNGPVGEQVRDAWWITITVDSLSINGRSIWDRDI